ncbi:hypothetical protein BSLA_02r4309 [Burkholderia stabilis]|nr:hypothetical protein BSLA_02r4309 [Burkholderia stabilis]
MADAVRNRTKRVRGWTIRRRTVRPGMSRNILWIFVIRITKQ